MRILLFFLLLTVSVFSRQLVAQNLQPFYAQNAMNPEVKAEYRGTVAYAGAFARPSEPQYLYLWVKAPVSEVGVRVLAPLTSVPAGAVSAPANEVTPLLGKSFDPAVEFQMPSEPIQTAAALRSKGASVSFNTFMRNDNEASLLPQPSGQKLNAQVFAAATSPIMQGLYRIRVDNVDKIAGSYLLQAGTMLSGNLIISTDLNSLISAIGQ